MTPQFPRRILMVDDDLGIRTIVQLTLEAATDWQVTLAESGAEGLALARSQPFDAILLDVMMPQQDGIETFHLLRAGAKITPVPVILFTAKTRRHELDTLLSLGVVGVITKPFKVTTLVQQVCMLLEWPLP